MEKALTTKDLIMHLVESGYRYRKPKCRTWKLAFILRHTNSVLCILFRKNGIDLRLYEQYKNEISIDKNNQISMVGGKLFRNHYNESSNLITQKIKVISSCFIKGRIIDEIRIQDGRSYLLNAEYQNIKEKYKDDLDNSPLGEWIARRDIQKNLKS
jgi:hypothetical protein